MPLASWWLALGWRENYSCCRFLSFHFLLMTAAFRVLQLVITYTYITGSDKSAIKCRVLFSRFWRFKKCIINFSKKEKRKQGRKREGRGKCKKAREKGKGKRKLLSYFLWTRKRNRVPNVLKIPKSNMWLEQSRVKVTFMHKISRMTTSLTVTKLKLETESHADEQTFRITRDAGFTFFGHKLRLGV